MPKSIPLALVTAQGQGVYHYSRLLKMGPLPDDSYVRVTSSDKDEVYDDGTGSATWYAGAGLQMSTIESTNDLAVDNAEAQSLVPVYPLQGITEDMVNRGTLDNVDFVVYEHLVGGAAGVHEIKGAGVIGRVRIEQGLVVIPELRAYTELLAQTGIISQTSLDCRTKRFGSQEGEEREWCGYDITAEWVPFTVTAVGDETVREFFTDDLPDGTYPSEDGLGYFAPGLVRWTVGDNAGASVEVESFSPGVGGGDAYVSLRFTTRKPIKVNDQGEIRRDCTRKWSGHNSCQTYFPTDRGAHFNGEPFINIGDTGANSIPGVNLTQSTGGTGE